MTITIPKSGSMPTGLFIIISNTYNAAKEANGILFAHGIGQRGDGSANNVSGWFKAECQDLINDVEQSNSILIAPELLFNENWYVNEKVKYFDFAYDYLRAHYNVNIKVKSNGVSLGGQAIWGWGALNQDKCASILGTCPVYIEVDFCKIKCPVEVYHANPDPQVSFSQGQNAVNRINSCSPTPNPLAKIIQYKSGIHEIWRTLYAEQAVKNFLVGSNAVITPPIFIPPPINPPVDTTLHADASATLTNVVGTKAKLDGSKSVGYTWATWEALSGPGDYWAVFPNFDKGGITKQITNLLVGKYKFRLSVFNAAGQNSTSDVEVNVQATVKPIFTEIAGPINITSSQKIVVYEDETTEIK